MSRNTMHVWLPDHDRGVVVLLIMYVYRILIPTVPTLCKMFAYRRKCLGCFADRGLPLCSPQSRVTQTFSTGSRE
jgi:hypothetical protein